MLRPGADRRPRRAGASAAESATVFGICAVVALIANWRLLHAHVLSADALVHDYWMWHWRDPQLFNDALTAELRHSARYPDGYRALMWLATRVGDPIAIGEWIGVGLMALSGWLVFRIAREHTAWAPAAWIAAGLFLALIELHRFYGGFPRAFVQPVVLLTVLLSLRRRFVAAALVAGGGALFYPPAAALAVGVLAVSALPGRDRRRVACAALAIAVAAAAVLVPALLAGGAPRVLTAAEARRFPEFGAHGTLHFFVPSFLEYIRQNRSGFDLRTSGSVLLVAAVALLLARRGNVRLLRREVLALPVVSLAAYLAAQAVLFRLYLPHRYTYPLIAFFAIAVGVTLRPTWVSLSGRWWTRFALLCAPLAVSAFAIYLFPLAPPVPRFAPGAPALAAIVGVWVAAAAVAAARLERASIGALVTGGALIAALVVLPGDGLVRAGTACPQRPVTRYLAQLPKAAVIAGDPADLLCVPATTHRAVVISTQLAPAYEADYFRSARARMFAMLRAYYGPSVQAIADLRTRYGATALWVRRDAIAREMAGRGRWRAGKLPYGRFVRQLLRTGEPASLHLPAACRRFARGPVEVYDIGCLSKFPVRRRQDRR